MGYDGIDVGSVVTGRGLYGGFGYGEGSRETRDYLYSKETRDQQSRDTRFIAAAVERANDNVNKGVCEVKDSIQVTAAANALLIAQENEKTRSLINDRDVQRLYSENARLQGMVTKADCGTPASSCGTVLGQCGGSSSASNNINISDIEIIVQRAIGSALAVAGK